MPTQPTERKSGRETSEYNLAQIAMIAAFALPVILPVFEKYIARLPENSMLSVLAGALISIGYSVSSAMRKKAILEADSAALKQPETITAGGDVSVGVQPQAQPVTPTKPQPLGEFTTFADGDFTPFSDEPEPFPAPQTIEVNDEPTR